MATLVAQVVALAGLTEVPVAADATAAGHDEFPNTGKEFLHVINGAGAPINVTVKAASKCDQGTLHDAVVAVPNAQERYIGPFNVKRFGAVPQVEYSDTTTITVALVQLNPA